MDDVTVGVTGGPESGAALGSRTSRDRQLVRAAVLGHEPAWDALVQAHAPRIWCVLRGSGLSRDEAAAVSELVWARLAQVLPDLQGEPVATWLDRTALRESENARARAGWATASRPWQGDRRRVARA